MTKKSESKLNKLQKNYEDSCNAYIQEFCDKQEMDFNGWIADVVGGVAECNNFTFNFHDIVWDVNGNAPIGLIVDWYYESVANYPKSINYFAYTKGLRYSDLKE
jgi:hypothetical protein